MRFSHVTTALFVARIQFEVTASKAETGNATSGSESAIIAVEGARLGREGNSPKASASVRRLWIFRNRLLCRADRQPTATVHTTTSPTTTKTMTKSGD